MSTGYMTKHQFVLKQPTSSGQAVEATSGVNVNFLDGATIKFSTGSKQLHANIQAIATTGGTIRSDGATIVTMTSDAVTSVLTLAAPSIGSQKKIFLTCSSSNVLRILGNTSDVVFGENALRHSIVSGASGVNRGTWGCHVELWSTGTATWRVTRLFGSSSEIALSTGIA